MILKDLDPFPTTTDARLRAGRAAEEQMAFYLKREFGRSESIFVLNGLRLEEGSDAAQMDHLIVHRGGFVIVESKSVHGRIRINDHGEWSRVYGPRQEGMSSPILQAKRQGDFLIYLLDDNAATLTGKTLGLVQKYFGTTSVDLIVAISDSGIIDRPQKYNPTELCKADQAPGLIRKRLEAQVKEASPLNFGAVFEKSRGRGLDKSEVETICRFLMEKHRPLAVNKAESPLVVRESQEKAEIPPLPTPKSSDMHGETLFMESGEALAAPTENAQSAVCAICEKPVTEAVQKYCEENSGRFGGAIYCYIHQKRRRAT